MTSVQYPLLRKSGHLAGGSSSSRFNLPLEFDSTKFAAGYYEEGQGALSMMGDQPVTGTNFLADGWNIWKYPDEGITGYDDDQKPIMGPHPMAGKPHKVAGSKAGENFVLMFRSADVQSQVNHVYGMLSIEQMTMEVRGETITAGGDDSGMLSHQRLNKDIEVEREIDQLSGRSAAVHQEIPAGQRIGKQAQRVSR